jgi:cytochrome c
MDNRTNTITGWVLAGCGAALGLSIVGGMLFRRATRRMGYAIEGVVEERALAIAAADDADRLAAAYQPPTPKGAGVFKKCAACHTINQGGIANDCLAEPVRHTLGKRSPRGQRAEYAFLAAWPASANTWDFDRRVADVAAQVRQRRKMTFAGPGNARNRASVICTSGSGVRTCRSGDPPRRALRRQ